MSLHRNLSNNCVVLLCELQPPIVLASRTVAGSELRRISAVLCNAAQALSIPVYVTAVPLAPDAPPEIIEEFKSHRTWVRTSIGALDDTALAMDIAATGRKIVALGGISSEVAILHSAIGARRLGYDVHVLVDLCGGLSERTERSAFAQMEAEGVVLSNLSSFLTSIVSDMTSHEGKVAMGAMGALWRW